jgi:hypothetical protein
MKVNVSVRFVRALIELVKITTVLLTLLFTFYKMM